MAEHFNKAAIIGCGAVGASTAYALSIQGIVSEMVLIDINKDKAEGEVMDINHGQAYFSPMEIYNGDYSDIVDCDIIIVCSGVGRKPGETRLDLARNNVKIAKSVAENMKPYYNGAIVIVVANPVDVLTYTIGTILDIPEHKIFGTGTMLDSARFKYYLSEALDVNIGNIHGYIVGEHGDSQFPVWETVNIAGTSLDEYCRESNITIDKADILNKVKTSGSEVIKRKGATYYAIASCVCRLVQAVLKNEHSILTVSSFINGLYGVEDVAISMPCIISSSGVEKVIKLNLSAEEEALFKTSAKTLKDTIKEVV